MNEEGQAASSLTSTCEAAQKVVEEAVEEGVGVAIACEAAQKDACPRIAPFLEQFVTQLRQTRQLSRRVSRVLTEAQLPAFHGRVVGAIAEILNREMPTAPNLDSNSTHTAFEDWLEVLSQYEHFVISHGVTSTFIADEKERLQRKCASIEGKLQVREQRVSKRKRELDVLEEQHNTERQTRLTEENTAQENTAEANAAMLVGKVQEGPLNKNTAEQTDNMLAGKEVRITQKRKFLHAGPNTVALEKLRMQLEQVGS